MTVELVMSGHDRTFVPPRSLRHKAQEESGPLASRIASGRCDAMDLLEMGDVPWAVQTLDSLVAAIDTEATDALGCTDCEDTGFYGLAATDNEDLLVTLVKRAGEGEFEHLAASGIWEPWTGDPGLELELISLDVAADLASALTAGASGLLRKYCHPLAFLPPAKVVTASLLADLVSAEPEASPRSEWVNFAIVDDDDAGAVMQVVRADADGNLEALQDGTWQPWEAKDGNLMAIELDEDTLGAVLTASGSKALLAYTSPNPKAEKLRRYWSTGRGGAKIRWGTPSDWRRCYRHLRKYLGLRAKGYCQNLHHRNTGLWTGSRLNASGSTSVEEDLVASVKSGSWSGESERNSDMLKDGIYGEVEDSDAGVFRTLIAGGFPVAPPKSWFDDPKLDGPTPMEIGDDGRVYGHIATWDATHIGMGGSVKPPKSASNYAYYRTGILATAEGEKVNVGQITLAGGHAPMHASAAEAVKHYDDTNSAVADVASGEDIYGIWVAGSLRPDVTASQIRAFRASPPSGDWRMINGNLELVAACSVNVPGFMNVRTQALAAGGAILSLVAAGARPLAERRMSMLADAAVLDRIDQLEKRLGTHPVPEPPVVQEPEPAVVPEPEPETVAATAVVAEPPVLEETVEEAVSAATDEHPDEVQPEPADKLDPDQVKQAREDARQIRKDWLRREAHGGWDDKGVQAAAVMERKGGGYPIKDEASLKNAIQAVGRAKPGDRAKTIAHIKAAAAKLGLTKLLPKTPGW
jgi:hypothetical protein